MNNLPEGQEQEQEPMVGNVPHRLLDGYDADGVAPPQTFLDQLLAGAPDYIRQRAAQVQAQKKTGAA